MTTPKITIVESVRDAMQGVKQFIPTQDKIEYINLLLKVGFDVVDFSSFVSPRHIPQLKDAEQVLAALDVSNTKLMILVGSKRGGEKAAAFEKIDCIAYPFSVSETFLKYNLNSNFTKSTETIEYIHNLCIKAGKELHIYLAMAFGNPYGDKWNTEIVLGWLEFLKKTGIKQISFSDPAAVAEYTVISKIFKSSSVEFPELDLGVHIHSQPHNWYEKVDAAYSNGCRRFDTVINGFGGCPMSHKELVGNLKTGDLLAYLGKRNIRKSLNMIAYELALKKAEKIFIS